MHRANVSSITALYLSQKFKIVGINHYKNNGSTLLIDGLLVRHPWTGENVSPVIRLHVSLVYDWVVAHKWSDQKNCSKNFLFQTAFVGVKSFSCVEKAELFTNCVFFSLTGNALAYSSAYIQQRGLRLKIESTKSFAAPMTLVSSSIA